MAVLYVGTMLALEPGGFWIGDNANKYLQLRALDASGYTDSAIPWPGLEIDPEIRWNPLPSPFSVVRDGRLHSTFPPAFAIVSSWPHRAFGMRGLYLLPLACSVLMLAGVAAIARRCGDRESGATAAVLVAGLATPVWFYAVVFWEHALAGALLCWSVVFHLCFLRDGRVSHLAAASALCAAGVYFREESILLAGLLLLSSLVDAGARLRTFAVCSVTTILALAPLAWLNWVSAGTPFGLHVGSILGSSTEYLATRPAVAYSMLVASGPGTALSWLFAAPFLVAWFWRPRLPDSSESKIVAACGVVAAGLGLTYLARFLASDNPISHLLQANSLFPAAVVLALGLFRTRDRSPVVDRLGLIILGVGLLQVLASTTLSSRGIHWGNRFLFILYPLLAALVGANLGRWLASPRFRLGARVAVVFLVLVSSATQLYSIHLLDVRKEFSARLNAELQKREETAIVTDLWWAPAALFSEFYEKPSFVVHSSRELRELRLRLRERGHRRVLLVRRPQDASPEAQVVADELNYFSLAFRGFAP